MNRKTAMDKLAEIERKVSRLEKEAINPLFYERGKVVDLALSDTMKDHVYRPLNEKVIKPTRRLFSNPDFNVVVQHARTAPLERVYGLDYRKLKGFLTIHSANFKWSVKKVSLKKGEIQLVGKSKYRKSQGEEDPIIWIRYEDLFKGELFTQGLANILQDLFKIKLPSKFVEDRMRRANANMVERVASKFAGARGKPRTLQGGTIKVPIRGGHVLISKWALDHIMRHNEIGTGSVFSRGINERTLISLVQKAPIKGNGGLYTMKASNVGYNLVLPMDEALRLPDATMTMTQKEERGKKIDVVAVETSAPLRSFQTNLVTLIIRPSNPQFLPQDAKQIPAILEDVRDGRSYSVLTAFPGNPDIPPSSQWGSKYAVIIPS